MIDTCLTFLLLIYRKIIETSLEDLNCTCVTKLAQIRKNLDG